MVYGLTPTMITLHIPVPTIGIAFARALLGLLKGFILGFFIALLYDLIACCLVCKKHGKEKKK
jgi:hypothetical protein